jgi:hypothetical protein
MAHRDGAASAARLVEALIGEAGDRSLAAE